MLLMGKSTMSMAIFNSKLLVYQRVHVKKTKRRPPMGVPQARWLVYFMENPFING
jgi:hydroxyacyl-ACP dehydratase HTD2-like protein with hotdog domain